MFAKWGFITFVFAANVYNQKALFMNLIYSMSTLAWISFDSSSSGFLLSFALFPLGTVCLLKFRFADFLRRYRALPFVAIIYIICSSLTVFKAALFDLLQKFWINFYNFLWVHIGCLISSQLLLLYYLHEVIWLDGV